jgi:hypothetical protein
MATGTAQRGPKPASSTADGRWIEYDEFIDKQLRKARGQVKGVELAGSLMALAAGGLLYFLAVSLVDHWLVPGGLGIGGRVLFFAVFLFAAAWYIARRLAPLVIRRINPIYAADTIEKSKPSLKNSLINFLFLRNERSGVPQVVYQAVEEQAANNLQRTQVEAAVDRTRLVHLGYVLLAAVALFAGYKLFSPKDPIETVGRVVMPWADIQAPTRVTITDVQPGSRTAYLGETVEVSAEIRGIGADEPVRILYTTADRQTVDEAVTMYRAPDAFRHTGKIPAGENGLQQDIEYRIEAGDAKSRPYFLTAAAAPTISVESIDFEFPAYTGLPKKHVVNAGDIQGLEGTRVTIHGRANQSLHSAQLVLDGTHHAELPIKPEGKDVTASFVLALDEKDRAAAKPEFSHYQLRPNARLKPEPVRYNIAVIPDYPPEISFIAPENDDVALPVNGSLPIEVRAQDADFALSEVTLTAELGEKTLFEQKLFSGNHAGPLVKKYNFVPAKLGLKEGDSVNYWASAKDNRTPTANEASTRHRQIRITKADLRQAKNGPNAQQPNDKSTGDNPPPQDNNPPDQNDKQQPHNPKDADRNQQQPEQPNNGNDRRNDQQDKKQQGADRENQKPDARQPDDQQPQNGQQPDRKQQDNRQQRDQKQNGKQQSGGQSNDQQDGKSEKSDQQQEGGNSGQQNQKSSDGGKSGKQSSGGNSNNQPPQNSTNDGGGSSEKTNSAGQAGKTAGGQQKSDGAQGAQPDNQPNNGQSNQQSPHHQQPNANQSGTTDKDAGKPQGAEQKNETNQNGNQQNGSAGQNDKQTPSANDIKQLKQTLDKQQQGGSGSNQSGNQQSGNPQSGNQKSGNQQSGNQQSGQKGASDKGSQGKSGADGAQDGSSQNPSQNPKGSNGPYPNGKPGTGGNRNQKPSGDQSGHQPGDKSSDADQNKPAGDKSNSSENREPGGQSNRSEKQSNQSEKQNGNPQSGQNPEGGGNSQQGDKRQPGDKTQSGDKSAAVKSTAPSGAKPDGTNPNSAKSDATKTDSTMQDGGERQSPDKRESNAEKGENKPGVNDPSKQGQGAQAKQGSQPSDKKTDEQNGGAKQNPDAKGGDSETMKGTSSTGPKATDDKGSPSPQEGNRPKDDKTNSPDNQSPKDSDSGDNGKSPTTSPRESNSQSQQNGDRSGNGKQGGGQGSNQAGTGGAGSKTASDEGKGTSNGQGKGETSNKLGTEKPSEKPTGQSGDEAGNGSHTSDKLADQGKPSDKPGDDQPGGGGATSGLGGNRTTPLPDSVTPDNSPINGDAANKQFAEKQFDLAIDKLKKGNPDLLKELNWSPDDARRLAERLEQMKSAAKNDRPDGDAARKMDELLRNLGPRAGQLTRHGDGTSDKQRGLQESSDSGPPSAYLEQFQAFQQGMLRDGK